MPQDADVAAIVTAFDRIDQTLESLRRIRACLPPPAEVLVHVDANQVDGADAIRKSGLADRVVVSASQVGPGGGRNVLMREATRTYVASFDDDSWPVDADYFAKLRAEFDRHPRAAVLAAHLFHRGDPIVALADRAQWRADFVGAGCAYRRDAFLETGGYVPLAVAYGMEEVDLGLRLHAAGHRILYAPSLRVYHDTDLAHHADRRVTAASIANIALLAYLRFPVRLWWVAAGQIANRIQWLLRHGRHRGVVSGLWSIPAHLRRFRSYRAPLQADAVGSFLALRRKPQPVE